MKKTSRDIHPRNIPTNFEKNPNIGCRVRGVDGRTDRPTDRPTDRRRATAIGPVDLTRTKLQLLHLPKKANTVYIPEVFFYMTIYFSY